MKNRTAVLLVAAGMLLNACNPLETSRPIETVAAAVTEAVTTVAEAASADTAALETEAKVYDPGLGIVANPLSDPPEELTFYWGTTFWFDDQEWSVDVYTSAEVSSDGYYGWDDQNRFYIRARNEAPDQFVLFDEWIQLGYPEIDVYDDGKRLHIILTDFRTASAVITDYSFLPEEYYFEETRLLEESGINYIGQIDVQ